MKSNPKYTYDYFCDQFEFTRKFKLHNGEIVYASIFIEKRDNEMYWVHVVKKKEVLDTVYVGYDIKKAWGKIPKTAVYVGSSDRYEKI